MRLQMSALDSVEGETEGTFAHRLSDEPGCEGRLVPMDLLQPLTAAQQVASSNTCTERARDHESCWYESRR